MDLRGTPLYDNLLARVQGDQAAEALAELVQNVVNDCAELSKTVVRYLPEYTLHDERHIGGVLDRMARLVPPTTTQGLQPLELGALILAAAFHDVGMAPSEEEVQALLADAPVPGWEDEWLAYRSHREHQVQLLRRQQQSAESDRKQEARQIEGFVLSQYVRKTHGERGRALVLRSCAGRLRYADYNFAADLADACFSHTLEPSDVGRLPCWKLVRAPGEYCNWRFVAVLLRLADILDFDPKRTPAVLFEHLGVRDRVSVREWKKHQSVTAWDVRPGRIAFAAQCMDPVIEKCVRIFLGDIDRELAHARMLLEGMHDAACADMRGRYALELASHVDARDVGPAIGPDGPAYEYVDIAFHLDQERIVSLLMGLNLYADRSLFIRELLQNAADACRHRTAIHEADPGLGRYDAQIVVRLREEEQAEVIEVEDNGVGMDEAIVREHFARVGSSYYVSERFRQEAMKAQPGFIPVSQFGIGVLSVFMAGDRLRVETRRLADGSRPLLIEVADQGALFWLRKGGRDAYGTRIILRLTCPSADLMEKQTTRRRGRPAGANGPSLAQTVIRIAPHVEVPIRVEEPTGTTQLVPHWELPAEGVPHRHHLRDMTIDLTRDGPSGLDGVVRVFALCEGSQLATEVRVVDAPEEEYCYDEDLTDRLVQRLGHVECQHVDRSEQRWGDVSYSVALGPQGRWSQSGFLVPCKLFSAPSWLRQLSEDAGSSVRFPLTVWYDVDLSGDFVLPLSVDRKSVLPTPEAEHACERISGVLARLLFEKMGADEVRANREVLDQFAPVSRARLRLEEMVADEVRTNREVSDESARVDHPFRVALRRFLEDASG